jgi:dipeptidyl aminopeptidase/acylaminoacyl peptidase
MPSAHVSGRFAVHMKHWVAFAAVCLATFAPLAQAGRPLTAQDWYRFQGVSGLTMTRDGSTVAYVVTAYDKSSDESRDAIWIADWSGGHSARVVQLQTEDYSPKPHFTPDGRSISFLSEGSKGDTTQLWLVDRQGGAPRRLSHVPGDVESYAWSPDGRHVALVVSANADGNPPRPIVIDALHFKQDRDGYLDTASLTHLYLLDVTSGNAQPLASDPQRADSEPAFSPDGHQLAFVGNRSDKPSELGVDEIYIVASTSGVAPRRLLTLWSPNHQHLEWSPDGASIALLRGDEPKYNAYIMDELVVADVASAKLRSLTRQLDRAILTPCFEADGKHLNFAVEDDGYQYPAQASFTDGKVARLAGPTVIEDLACGGGHTAVLATTDRSAVEVYALEQSKLRALSSHNQALLGEWTLGTVQDISFKSRDGTEVHGQVVKPTGFVTGRRYPTILWIHGGPNGQDDHSLELDGYGPPLERQLFATHGYLVLAINYRGSTGRGGHFARSIFADWGDKEVADLLAGVDYVVASGLADPARLGVGGWSYGGLLTDYVIASDARFKAAISGAGSGNQLSMYGMDQYVLQYNAEMGAPWRTTDRWLKVSYPFFHADRIHTPTLFLGGSKDFNVPIAGGEQMYEALRTLGVPAQLIVYPGQYHVLTRPSFLVDRFQRYLDWMDRYLGKP